MKKPTKKFKDARNYELTLSDDEYKLAMGIYKLEMLLEKKTAPIHEKLRELQRKCTHRYYLHDYDAGWADYYCKICGKRQK